MAKLGANVTLRLHLSIKKEIKKIVLDASVILGSSVNYSIYNLTNIDMSKLTFKALNMPNIIFALKIIKPEQQPPDPHNQ